MAGLPREGPPEGGHWLWVDNQVVERISEIGPLDLAVYVTLAKFSNRQRKCNPSMKTIASICGTTKKSARSAIGRLSAAGLIAVTAERDAKRSLCANQYELLPLPPREARDPRLGKQQTLGWGSNGPHPREISDPPLGKPETPEQEPLNKTQGTSARKRAQKRTPSNGIHPEGFDQWWSVYPRKTSKERARKAWADAVTRISDEDHERAALAVEKLQQAVAAFADSPLIRQLRSANEMRYCPYPATWLNDGRYDDDPQTWQGSNHGRNRNGHAGGPGEQFDPLATTDI